MRNVLACFVAIAVAASTSLPWQPGGIGARSLAAQPADTIAVRPLFTERDAIFAGAFIVGTIAAFPLDKRLADALQGQPQANQLLRRLAIGVENIALPGAFAIGGALYGVGRLTENERMADLGLHGTEAIVIGLVATSAIKFTVGRARPYVGKGPKHFAPMQGFRDEDYRSFPSGHTLIGFAAAAAVTDEARRWRARSVWIVGPVLYTGAAAVGLSRMYDNKHWASDVVMGAAIGTLSGLKVVRYHHSRPDNRLDRWLLGVSGMPVGRERVWRLMVLPALD